MRDAPLVPIVDATRLACPRCQGGKSKVISSAPRHGGIWRRRECLACGRRFTTEETIRGRVREEARVIDPH